jgi:hypothetical protein
MQIDERQEAISNLDVQEAGTIPGAGLSVERGLASGGSLQHASLGSSHTRVSFELLERTKSTDCAFTRFRIRLGDFLSRSLPAYGILLNNWIKFGPGEKVRILLNDAFQLLHHGFLDNGISFPESQLRIYR